LLNDFFDWLQNSWGAQTPGDGTSYSQLLLSSLNFWGLLEGTHLLMLMLFFGTILLVDLRMLGIGFREYRISVLSNRVLPLTVVAFLFMVVTGLLLFFAKPEIYWHNLWFRLKLVLLVVAVINIVVFHYMVQKNQAAWDELPRPPPKVRMSALISLTSWILIIAFGRFIAYNWFECGKPQPDWVNSVQECAASSKGAQNLAGLSTGGGEH
jgi:uncharacterized membrane protein